MFVILFFIYYYMLIKDFEYVFVFNFVDLDKNYCRLVLLLCGMKIFVNYYVNILFYNFFEVR